MSAIPSSDFNAFCEFVVQIRNSGVQNLTPEQSVEQFRQAQEKLRLWNERNALSEEQARRGAARPLDLEDVLSRVHDRLGDKRTAN